MTYLTVALSKSFEHRYKFDAYVYNLLEKDFEQVTVFLDTGCYNTMLPRHLAEKSGHSLGFKVKYSLGPRVVASKFLTGG